MVARFVVGLFSNASISPAVSKQINALLGPLAGYVQVREHWKKRRYTVPLAWWVPKERKYFDEYLTKESKDFIQDVIKYKYLQPNESPLKEPPWDRGEWTSDSVRTGVIARKIGVYPMWTKAGKRILTTLLQVVDNHVIRYHTPEVYAVLGSGKKSSPNRKLGCIVVGAESRDPQKFTAQYNGLFNEAGVMPKLKLTRFFITPNATLQPGTPLYATHFRVGDYVDVSGKTIDRGFQGVVKRWGFKGGPKGHGCTKFHRKPGCIGGGIKRGVWKGKKLPGQMGLKTRKIHGLKIWRINTRHNVIWVQGSSVPGPTNSFVYIVDCRMAKHRHTEDGHPPFPTYFPGDEKEPLPEELYHKDLHLFSDPSIEFKEEGENVQ